MTRYVPAASGPRPANRSGSRRPPVRCRAARLGRTSDKERRRGGKSAVVAGYQRRGDGTPGHTGELWPAHRSLKVSTIVDPLPIDKSSSSRRQAGPLDRFISRALRQLHDPPTRRRGDKRTTAVPRPAPARAGHGRSPPGRTDCRQYCSRAARTSRTTSSSFIVFAPRQCPACRLPAARTPRPGRPPRYARARPHWRCACNSMLTSNPSRAPQPSRCGGRPRSPDRARESIEQIPA